MNRHTPSFTPTPSTRRKRAAGPLLLLPLAASLLAACASPVSAVLGGGQGADAWQVALPLGFEDITAEAERRRRETDRAGTALVSWRNLVVFHDEHGSRGCAVHVLHVAPASPLYPLGAPMLLQALAQHQTRQQWESNPWRVLADGQRLGLAPMADQRPTSSVPKASRPAHLGAHQGWLAVTEHTWAAQTGPYEVRSRSAALAAELAVPRVGRRSWLVAHCGAAHLPEYLPGYLDDMIAALEGGQWPAQAMAVSE